MKDGIFVLDAHTGVWDASKENCKNRFGEAFIETFYAFHQGFNPPDPKWKMDYEKEFRKTDMDWYIDEMFVRGDADVAILSTQVLFDFYHKGFVTAEGNKAVHDRLPERIIPLGGVDPRAPNAVAEVDAVSAAGKTPQFRSSAICSKKVRKFWCRLPRNPSARKAPASPATLRCRGGFWCICRLSTTLASRGKSLQKKSACG